jgi:hypothetical protein
MSVAIPYPRGPATRAARRPVSPRKEDSPGMSVDPDSERIAMTTQRAGPNSNIKGWGLVSPIIKLAAIIKG